MGFSPRRWFDGSFAEDLPAKRLARLIHPIALPFVAEPKLKNIKGLRRNLSNIFMDILKGGLISTEKVMSNHGG